MTDIHRYGPAVKRPVVDFTISPLGASVTYSSYGNSYPPAGTRFAAYYVPINTLLTFTAAATMPTGISIVEYRWDFGNGTYGFGPSTTYTYKVAVPQTSVSLQITDNENHHWSRSRVINLAV